MKFIVGFLGGLVIGAVGAVAYSVQTGRDLRLVVDEVRSDLSKRDLDALGTRLESRFAEMQKDLESRISAVKDKASAAVDEAGSKAQGAADAAVDRTDEILDVAAEGASDAVAAAGEAVAEVKDAVKDQPQG